jgi:5,10-methenyltetrahydrofolate synthetase
MVNHKDGVSPMPAAASPADGTVSNDPTTIGASADVASRPALRQRLLAARAEFALRDDVSIAGTSLAGHLIELLATLEPECLGLYWPVRDEFDAPLVLFADAEFRDLMASRQLALPFAFKEPPSMEFRRWDGREPTTVDEFKVGSTTGARIVPDVIVVPCVGFTAAGYRLGYGGGYFDRWLAQHPHVTTIGLAWSNAEMQEADFTPLPHDIPLTMIVTEKGVVG